MTDSEQELGGGDRACEINIVGLTLLTWRNEAVPLPMPVDEWNQRTQVCVNVLSRSLLDTISSGLLHVLDQLGNRYLGISNQYSSN